MKNKNSAKGVKKKDVKPAVVVKPSPHAAIFAGLEAGGATIKHPNSAEIQKIRLGIIPSRFSVVAVVKFVDGARINIDYCNTRRRVEIRLHKDGILVALTAIPFCGNPTIVLDDPDTIKNTLMGLANGSIWADECWRAKNPPATTAAVP